MKAAQVIAIILLLLVLALAAFDASRPASICKTAAKIQIGDGRERVQSLLGRPTRSVVTSGMGVLLTGAPERWFYGNLLDWQRPFCREFPWVAPLKLRLFQADTNDVAVDFDSTGRVVRVQIPET